MKDCIIHDCEQRSPEWHELRKGVLTASNFGAWLLEKLEVRLTIDEIKRVLEKHGIAFPKTGKKEDYVALLPDVKPFLGYTATTRKARETAICQLLAEVAGCWEPPSFENAAMARGTMLEPQAVKAFAQWSGLDVIPAGFCRSIHGLFGCSPDGLVGPDSGLECKVPAPATHIAYRRAGVLPEEYALQVHGCMAVTGASSWWFQSWNPGLPALRIRVERTAFTDELRDALIAFSAELEAAMEMESAAWAAEFEVVESDTEEAA